MHKASLDLPEKQRLEPGFGQCEEGGDEKTDHPLASFVAARAPEQPARDQAGPGGGAEPRPGSAGDLTLDLSGNVEACLQRDDLATEATSRRFEPLDQGLRLRVSSHSWSLASSERVRGKAGGAGFRR